MDALTIISFVVYGYFMYRLGRSGAMRLVGDQYIQETLNRAAIPVTVLEKIEGNYYLFEKDSTNFLCQAEKLEDIPLKLWENKKISLAVILFPEESADQTFWCINGKLKTIQGK